VEVNLDRPGPRLQSTRVLPMMTDPRTCLEEILGEADQLIRRRLEQTRLATS